MKALRHGPRRSAAENHRRRANRTGAKSLLPPRDCRDVERIAGIDVGQAELGVTIRSPQADSNRRRLVNAHHVKELPGRHRPGVVAAAAIAREGLAP
jgi:hypothetical protein